MLVAAIGCASGAPAPAPKVQASEEWAAILPGSWGWPEARLTCSENPHRIQLSPDRTAVHLEHRAPVTTTRDTREQRFRYQVLGQGPSSLRLLLEGETRETKEGEPVVWDLVMLTRDRYCWHRTDWPENACTPVIERCSGERD